jgi:hypothetical protein
VIVSLLMWSSYRAIARVFKWLTLVLLAYVLTAFVARVDWRLALSHRRNGHGFIRLLLFESPSMVLEYAGFKGWA